MLTIEHTHPYGLGEWKNPSQISIIYMCQTHGYGPYSPTYRKSNDANFFTQKKAFDLVSWQYLLKVLNTFGLNKSAINYIKAIYDNP